MQQGNSSVNKILREALAKIQEEHGIAINHMLVNYIDNRVAGGDDSQYIESITIDAKITN